MAEQTRPAARGSSTLVRSKSLRLPTTRKQSEQQSGSSTLTRHGSMRLHRGGSTSANPPTMSASYHGQLTKAPDPAPDPATKKTSSALSALRRPFQRFRAGSATEKKDGLPKAMSVSVHGDLMGCAGGDGTAKAPEEDWRRHFKRLMQEHEKLQMKYARLRNQLLEREALHAQLKPPPAPASRDLATIPEDDGDSPDSELPPSLQSSPAIRGYHEEIRSLQDQVRNVQKKYWDLVVTNEKCAKDDSAALVVDLLKQVEQKQIDLACANTRIEKLEEELCQLKREVATCHDALHDYQLEMEYQQALHISLHSQLEDKDAQLADAHESAEFLQAEISTLSEAHQESEQARKALEQDLQHYAEGTRDLYERCQKLYHKVQEKKIKILQLRAEIESHNQTHDMLVTQGAEMNTAASSLTQISLKLHSFLKMSAVFATAQLQLDSEVLDEIMDDCDILEEPVSSSSSTPSSLGPLRPKELSNGIIRSSSLEPLYATKINGESNSNSSYSTPISELPSPSTNGESLVHMVLQAASLVQPRKDHKEAEEVEEEPRGVPDSTAPPHVPQNNGAAVEAAAEKNGVTTTEVHRAPEVGKPVGTVPPFRTVSTDVNGHHRDVPKHGCLDSLVAELTTLSGKLLRIHSMLHSRVQDRMRMSQEQIDELKKNLDTICQKNVDSIQESTFLKQQLDQALSRVSNLEEKLQSVHESYRKEIEILFQQIEDLKEKNRCLMAVNQEQARQLKEELLSLRDNHGYAQEADIACDKFELKQEVANLKEEALSKDEQFRSLAGKFARFKKAYEDNYQRATEDIDKLDTMIERVIETLQSVPEVTSNCPPLQGLLENLTGTGYSPSKQSPIRRPPKATVCHMTTL
ncbi:sperm-associated antigen 5-like [Ornithodoros turicata]|uniref:sperm-associated antigen 5-like n=1 Tax=Ornithodoros turicata TaxID=34597 RepID=UPI003139A280